MGWCRLKIAGVEHCGLCGLAHMGHGRTCPHLNDEKQVETLLMTLKESTESRELVDEAVRYLRVIRGDLVSQRRQRERRAIQEREAQIAARQGYLDSVSAPPVGTSSSEFGRSTMNGHGPGISIGANTGDYRPPSYHQAAPIHNDA